MTSRTLRRLALAILLGVCSNALSGCAVQSVRAYQRERLTDRIMSFESSAKQDARRTKSFDAREGSTGGNGGSGGGCACN